MFKRLAEAYRKIRNTSRYLLSNLFDFDPAQHAVAEPELDDELDRYALAYHRQLVARVLDAYDSFEFHLVYHELVGYCAADLSSVYLDILKDRLYCEAPESRRRRSAQTVLHRVLGDVTLLMAPVLPLTADEVWSLIPRAHQPSVHMASFPARERWDDELIARWQTQLFPVRSAVLKALEETRASRQIASGLEAGVEIQGSAAQLEPLRRYEAESHGFPGNLANLFIVSHVTLTESEGPLSVAVAPAGGSKCERCWTYSKKVGSLAVHPGVCERCARVLEGL
jgi:isoleucyl-tRNA synthetase